ncbi:hypothetical protein [Synechococcus sp. A15-44]|uniref:hypothetical protein n=1 Tax=Synechococcus sp. A15-44 TaxID=1050646 RepID=UPI001644DC41|nr:hypothetical protein [Synechococcus sp. A15-44]QNI65344.1 hypothetical protein SynA1544_02420 [Synechococcus sp. A15-44]
MTKVSIGRQKTLKTQLEHVAHEAELMAGKRRRENTTDRSGSQFRPIDEYDSIRPLWRKRSD